MLIYKLEKVASRGCSSSVSGGVDERKISWGPLVEACRRSPSRISTAALKGASHVNCLDHYRNHSGPRPLLPADGRPSHACINPLRRYTARRQQAGVGAATNT